MLQRIAGFLITVLFCLPSLSTEIPIDKDVQIISIQSVDGEVVVEPKQGDQLSLRVRKTLPAKASSDIKDANESWVVRWEKEGSKLIVKVEPQVINVFGSEYLGGWPRFTLQIAAPQKPLEIISRKGNISVANWQHGISATVLDGTIDIKKSRGDLQLSLQQANFVSTIMKGPLMLITTKLKLQ
ncbi:MAG: hypothetical protein R2827_10195 [Bdellovibrionales bacterium]